MYQGYARPFRLYEPILLILKTADTRIEVVCEAVWRQLLREQPTRGYDAMKDAIMRDRLGDLIRRYYPSEAAPLGQSCYNLTRSKLISRYRPSCHLRRVVVDVAELCGWVGYDCLVGCWSWIEGCLGDRRWVV
jgi:hypothetical protein